MKQRDSERLHSDVRRKLTGSDVINHGAAFGMIKIPAGLGPFACGHGLQRPRTSSTRPSARQNTISKQPKGVPNWTIGANIIGQQSIGADLLGVTPFETYQASLAKGQMTYAGGFIRRWLDYRQ